MAKVGLKGFWMGDYAETTKGTVTFTGGKKVAKAVQFTENATVSEAELYADDGLDDSESVVTKLQIGITPNGFDPEDLRELTGARTVSNVALGGVSGTALTARGPVDEGTRKGIGILTTNRQSGRKSYMATVYPAAKFRAPDSREENTKGNNLNFATSTYTGNCYEDKSGNFIYEKDFETEAAAITFLNSVFGVSAPGILLNIHDTDVEENGSITLKAAVPSGETVTWSSDDTDKATVTSGGVVAGVAEGTVTITASVTTGGHTYTDTCTVRVTAAE